MPDAAVIAVGCTVLFGLVVGRLQVLVARADTARYAAKGAGRDRSVVAGPARVATV